MITTSALYRSLLADPNHVIEWKISVNGVDYGEEQIDWSLGGGDKRPRITRQMFTGSGPETGACVSNRFACALFEASANIPRMATVEPFYRLKKGSQASEWIQKGVYYIDTRTPNAATGSLSLSCYDAMLKADGEGGQSYAQLTSLSTWPQAMADVAADIAGILGVTLDSRCVFHTGAAYMVQYPNDFTPREVLGFIAAAHGGCWTMTDAGKLRLVPLTGNGEGVSVGWALKSLSNPPALAAWSGVELYYQDGESYAAGDATGRVITADEPWATQATATGLLSDLSGSAYVPYSASGVFMDLAAELGDTISLGGAGGPVSASVSSCIWAMEIVCDQSGRCTVSAPGEEEIDHEYPYSSQVQRTLQRKVGLGVPYYGTTISREHGLTIARSDGKSDVTMNSDMMRFRGKVDGVMVDQIYFDPSTGRYVFNGSLGADAVFTDSLYAEQGNIADLTVSRLDTGNYIARYLTRNISDLNHIQITTDGYGLPHIYLMTSSVQKASAETEGYERLTDSGGNALYWTDELLTATTNEETEYPAYIAVTTLTNPYGEAVYWSQDISGATITDGYPYVDGVRVYTTTDDTGYPVMVWDYNSQAKVDLTFVMGASGFYEPRIILGSGDNYGTSRGYIYKGQSGLDIVYDRSDESGELALRLNDSGGIQKSLTTNGQTVQGTVAGMLIFENLYVGTSDWTLESPATFTTYPYAATLTCTGADATMGGEVIFDPDDISTGSLATAAQSGTNTVTIYASEPMAVTVLRVELRF